MAKRMSSDTKSNQHDSNRTQNLMGVISDRDMALEASEAKDDNLDIIACQAHAGLSMATDAPMTRFSGGTWDFRMQFPRPSIGTNPLERVSYSVSRFEGPVVFKKPTPQYPPIHNIITGLGNFERLPSELRIKIWKLLVPYADYVRRLPVQCQGEVQYDKVPSLLLTSRAVSSEYSVELYRINRVLRIVIHPENEILTSYNSLLQEPKSNVDLSRFETLRIEFRFPGFQDVTPLQHPSSTKHVPKRPIAKLLDWLELYEDRFRGFEKIISQKFAEIEAASKTRPAIELAFPENETESWWERAEDVDGQNYSHGWIIKYSTRVNACLEKYRLHGGRKLQIRLDPNAEILSRRANKLVMRLLISDSNALHMAEHFMREQSRNEIRYTSSVAKIYRELPGPTEKSTQLRYLRYIFGI